MFIINTIAGQQQYFRVSPSDTDAREGTSVILKCEVGNRAGEVQWAKDGFVLEKKNICTGKWGLLSWQLVKSDK
uniref:Ig-like domain-containing protein n=1 Tax=Strigamia maritima TaxID=126957 RepID=T1IZV3_STRMM